MRYKEAGDAFGDDNLVGYIRGDGKYVLYDKSTLEYAVFNFDRKFGTNPTIITYYPAKLRYYEDARDNGTIQDSRKKFMKQLPHVENELRRKAHQEYVNKQQELRKAAEEEKKQQMIDKKRKGAEKYARRMQKNK